jgi:hypothetical protein
MTKEMTIGDFVKECETYRYSTEHFNLLKECTELELMDTYLEAAAYLEEHADIDPEVRATFITEATEEGEEKTGTKSAEKTERTAKVADAKVVKRKSIWSKILKGFKRIFRAIKSVWDRFMRFLQGNYKDRVAQLESEFAALTDRLNNLTEPELAKFVDNFSRITDGFVEVHTKGDSVALFKATKAAKTNKNIAAFMKAVKNLEGVDSVKVDKAMGILINSTSTQLVILIPEIASPDTVNDLLGKIDEVLAESQSRGMPLNTDKIEGLLAEITRNIKRSNPRLLTYRTSYEDLANKQEQIKAKADKVTAQLEDIKERLMIIDNEIESDEVAHIERYMTNLLASWNEITGKSISVMNEIVLKCKASLTYLENIKELLKV